MTAHVSYLSGIYIYSLISKKCTLSGALLFCGALHIFDNIRQLYGEADTGRVGVLDPDASVA